MDQAKRAGAEFQTAVSEACEHLREAARLCEEREKVRAELDAAWKRIDALLAR